MNRGSTSVKMMTNDEDTCELRVAVREMWALFVSLGGALFRRSCTSFVQQYQATK